MSHAEMQYKSPKFNEQLQLQSNNICVKFAN